LRAELAEVVKVRERSATLETDLEVAKELFDRMTYDRLEGRGSDAELIKARDHKDSLEAQANLLAAPDRCRDRPATSADGRYHGDSAVGRVLDWVRAESRD
jgi:hypothetical protein